MPGGRQEAEVPDGDVAPAAAAAVAAAPAVRPADWLSQAAPLAVEVGWTMAVLYEKIGPVPGGVPEIPDQLPTVNELGDYGRCQVESARIRCLLAQLGALVGAGGLFPVPNGDILNAPQGDRPALQTLLINLNRQILEAFACADRDLIVAYQIGRALRDTASPPVDPQVRAEDQVLRAFRRRRIARIQEWLKSIAGSLPSESAAIVSGSLGRWSDFIGTTLDRSTPGSLLAIRQAKFHALATEVQGYLLAQGDIWISLLAGADTGDTLLSPEGRLAAAEASVSRAARMVRQVATHYAGAITVVLAALGGTFYLSQLYLGGAAKVWTDIASLAGSLGITARGIAARVGKLVQEGAQPIYALETTEAKAWAITTLPDVRLTPRGSIRLRRAGIYPSRGLAAA